MKWDCIVLPQPPIRRIIKEMVSKLEAARHEIVPQRISNEGTGISGRSSLLFSRMALSRHGPKLRIFSAVLDEYIDRTIAYG